MKLAAYLPLLLLNPLLSTAQLTKGQWMVGGSGDLSYTSNVHKTANSNDNVQQTAYNIFPGAGYFFIDRFVAGLQGNFSSSKSTEKKNGGSNGFYYGGSDETLAQGAGIGLFARYYLYKPVSIFNVFAQAAYTYNSIKETSHSVYGSSGPYGPGSSYYDTETKYKINYYSITAGPAIFIGSKVSFELSLGYAFGKVPNEDQSIDRLTVGTGFQVFLGK